MGFVFKGTGGDGVQFLSPWPMQTIDSAGNLSQTENMSDMT